MSQKKNTGGPAFPCSALVYNEDGKDPTTIIHDGMTLRDYFAAKAMHAIMAPNPVTGQYPQTIEFEACAIGAYQMADAMLKARDA